MPKTNIYFAAEIIADSVSPSGVRLTTMTVAMPRLVLAEFNTHRMFSRNSASTRAIPAGKRLREVIEQPFVPDCFPVNRPGMQSHEFLEGNEHQQAVETWLRGRNRAVATTLELLIGRELCQQYFSSSEDPKLRDANLIEALLAEHKGEGPNIHKQIACRPLETYLWHTVLASATEWDNFFALRISPDAQRQIYLAAVEMKQAMNASTPRPLEEGQWHLPLVRPDEQEAAAADPGNWAKISAGRCARVSYLTHDGRRDTDKDVELYEKLASSGHMSPLEHVARPMTPTESRQSEWAGNFRGWMQLRKTLPNEHDRSLHLAENGDQ